MLNLNIIIVGAGIAGLSSAISLRRSGHKITVLERHPSCQAVGGPVGLTANSTRVLIEYGMGDIMAERNSRGKNTIYQRRYDNDAVLMAVPSGQSLETYGFPNWAFAQCKLQEALAQVAEERGVDILFNMQVVSVDLEKPAVHLKNGTVMEADLIIGADGIRSVIRDAVGGGIPIQTISPFSAYNVDIPRSLLSADPNLSRLLTESNFWLGPSQIVAAVNMPDLGDKMNICLISEEGEGKEGEWYTLGDLEKVKKKFAHFTPVVGKILELAKPEDCYIWRLSEMPPLERWVSEGGKVVIVGDAGHTMLPYANQGASQCIEDSASLALCLERAETLEDIPKALAAFETIRRLRTEWCIKKGRQNAQMLHMPDGEEQQKRDSFLGRRRDGIKSIWDGKMIDEPPEGMFNPLTFPYVEGFDVFDYTKQKLQEILG